MVGTHKNNPSPFYRVANKPRHALGFFWNGKRNEYLAFSVPPLLGLMGVFIAGLGIHTLYPLLKWGGFGELVPYYAFLGAFIGLFFIVVSLWRNFYMPYRDGKEFARSLIGMEQRIAPKKNTSTTLLGDNIIIDLPGRLASNAFSKSTHVEPYPRLFSVSLADLVEERKNNRDEDDTGIPLGSWEEQEGDLNSKRHARPLERMALLSGYRSKRKDGWIRLAERIVQEEIEDMLRKKEQKGLNPPYKKKRKLDIPVAMVSNELDKIIRDSHGLTN